MAKGGEDWLGQSDDDRDGAEQPETQDQCQADADTASFRALMLGKLVGEDRNENQVVDAEHHLHHDQG
jgi:hypothetical protein